MDNNVSIPSAGQCPARQEPLSWPLLVVVFLLMVYMPLILIIDTYFFFIRPPGLFSLAYMLGIQGLVEKMVFYKLVLCFAGCLLYWVTGGLLLARLRIPTIKVAVTLLIAGYLVNSAAIMIFSRYSVPQPFNREWSDMIFNAYNQNAVLSILLAAYLYGSRGVRRIYGVHRAANTV